VIICDSLYVEVYRTFGGGALSSDMVEDYLSDSLNFRFRIGSYDEYYGGIYYTCNGDTLSIQKVRKDELGLQKVVIERKDYSIKKIKRKKLKWQHEIFEIVSYPEFLMSVSDESHE
jgi:hypothetical protein